jgi:hypothetical protein
MVFVMQAEKLTKSCCPANTDVRGWENGVANLIYARQDDGLDERQSYRTNALDRGKELLRQPIHGCLGCIVGFPWFGQELHAEHQQGQGGAELHRGFGKALNQPLPAKYREPVVGCREVLVHDGGAVEADGFKDTARRFPRDVVQARAARQRAEDVRIKEERLWKRTQAVGRDGMPVSE